MAELYRHTQIGYVTLISLGVPFLLIAAMMTYHMVVSGFKGVVLVLLSVLVLLGLCIVAFGTLTVAIKGDALEVRFGPGVIRKRFPLKDIECVQVVKNPWYYGWGIRWTPHGWLYNVSGFYAIELKMATGKRYRIGTDTPNELERAIRQAIGGVVPKR